MWPIEIIPDKDRLYCRIHKTNFRNNQIAPVAFKERGENEKRGMSTDWEKYSTPFETKQRARIPTDNGVISFTTGNLRKVNLTVVHDPDIDFNNRAHTNVKGINTEIRLKLLDLVTWEIPIMNN